jgi:hypothetical protein
MLATECWQRNDKPGFVEDVHFSGTTITRRLKQPTRRYDEPDRFEVTEATVPSAWPCSRWGLPSQPVTRTAGALLPHRFTLTTHSRNCRSAVCFLLHFPDPRGRWALPTTESCGARTFLQMLPSSERLLLCQHLDIVNAWVFPATRFMATKLQISNFCAGDRTEPAGLGGVQPDI